MSLLGWFSELVICQVGSNIIKFVDKVVVHLLVQSGNNYSQHHNLFQNPLYNQQSIMEQELHQQKKQLNNHREGLIQHLQTKLEQLKQERNHYFQNKQPKQQFARTGNYDYQQGCDKYGRRIEEDQKYLLKVREIELEELYRRKKELQFIGIIENDKDAINQLYTNPKSKERIQRMVAKKQKDEEKKAQKFKVIAQQTKKAQSFLKMSKLKDQKLLQRQLMHYKHLLLDSPQNLQRYSKLINKSNLTLVEKQDLLDMTFRMIQERNDQLNKQRLQLFLNANKEFCNKFYIGKAEISRDLEVQQTKKKGYFDFMEFYEFVKSIQLTNPALKPGIKNDLILSKIQKTKANTNIKNKIKQPSFAALDKQLKVYTKKIFQYIDKKHQHVIERQKLQLCLSKNMLFDEKEYKTIKKQHIKQYSQYLKKKRIRVQQKDYFKGLDEKYIGYEQFLVSISKFMKKEVEDEQEEERKKEQEEEKRQKEQEQHQKQQEENDKEEQNQQEKQNQQVEPELNDFQKYGWKKEIKPEKFSQLNQFDNFIKQIYTKNQNQIKQNGFERYREDFSKFDLAIQVLNQKHQKQ